MGTQASEKPLRQSNEPLVIAIVASPRDGEVTCDLLRTALDGERPYELVGVLGTREVYDGVEWDPRPDAAAGPLARWGEHLAHARGRGLRYLLVQLDEGSPRDLPAPAALTCALGAGGAGTARAGARGLSFSARSPMADVGARDVRCAFGLTRFTAVTPTWSDTVAVPLTGRFNVGPALAAISVCELLGIDEGQVATGLLLARSTAHGGLFASHDQRLFAVIEDSPDPRDGRRLAEAAREEYPGFAHEVVRGTDAVAGAVARAAGRDGRTMLVLLGASAGELEDAFQAAVRRLG